MGERTKRPLARVRCPECGLTLLARPWTWCSRECETESLKRGLRSRFFACVQCGESTCALMGRRFQSKVCDACAPDGRPVHGPPPPRGWCRSCETPLTLPEKGHRPVYCADCHPDVQRQPRRCDLCGQQHQGHGLRCDRCKHRTRYAPVTVPLNCAECGSAFERAGFRHATTNYCSTLCRYKARRAQDKERARTPAGRDANRTKNHRRRARLNGATSEPFAPAEVFDRDDWRCQLCGVRCLKAATYPHPRYPTLDHIVPLSKGGDHTRANVQCACLRCNTAKGNRTIKPEQLRLLG